MKKIAIVVNASRKDFDQLEPTNLDTIAQNYGIEYDLYIKQPDELEGLIKSLAKQDLQAIVIGGGDGTVRNAAQVLVGQNIPLVILPLGTFNYFARELKHPKDIEAVFKIIKQYKLKWVDVGEINQIIFINHAAIGLYAKIIKLKEKHSRFFGKNKLLKVLFNAFNIFTKLPIYHLTMLVNDKEVSIRTCLIFIGNNYHFTDLLNFGERKSLTAGMLSISVLHCQNRWEIFQCILSNLFNTKNKDKYVIQYTIKQMTIAAQAKKMFVVIDGELFQFETPLNCIIHSKQLPILAAE